MQPPGTDVVELKVRLDRQLGGDYATTVSMPDGSARGLFAVPHEDLSLDFTGQFLVTQQEIKRSSSSTTRDRAVDIGRVLFHALFTGAVRALYERAAWGSRSIRLRIVTDDPPALALPWELLYDDVVRQDFIALATESSVLRTSYPPDALRRLTPARAPLRVLAVTADQTGMLETERDVALLVALARERSYLQVEPLEHVTMGRLRERLRDGPPFHVLHFAGSGTVVGQGAGARQLLALEPDTTTTDGARLLSAQVAAAELAKVPELRLVYLSACHTDEVAATLAASIPAVVGVRGEITVQGCTSFADSFYRELAAGRSVDVAAWYARRNLETEFPGRREWAGVTLYLNGDGPLLHRLDAIAAGGGATFTDTPAPADDPGSRRKTLLRRRQSILERNLESARTQLVSLGDAAPEALRVEAERLTSDLDGVSGQLGGSA